MSQEIAEQLFHEDNIKIVLLAGVAVVWIVVSTVSGLLKGLARERTKREIAAYVAEGSITPEQGEKLIKVEKSDDCFDCDCDD